jgi:hypothetical protein
METINGKRCLVLDSPTIIPAGRGKDTEVWNFFVRLLGKEQCLHFFAWLKQSREALLAKTFRQGPAVILVGKAGHGKTIAGKLISKVLGGRVADPSQFAQGDTVFNAHLFGAELLFSDDKGGGNDTYKAQLKTAGIVKSLVATEMPECHGKNRTPVCLQPFWRVLFALNDEPEDLKVLPTLSDGIMDKLNIFKTVGRAVGWSLQADEQRAAAGIKALMDGLPDFIGQLERWKVPAAALSGRFGLTGYHNQEVLDGMQSFAPETKLLELIDMGDLPSTSLEAREVETFLKEHEMESVRRDAMNLLKGPGSCGKYLSRLAKRRPDRVTKSGGHHETARYSITARTNSPN